MDGFSEFGKLQNTGAPSSLQIVLAPAPSAHCAGCGGDLDQHTLRRVQIHLNFSYIQTALYGLTLFATLAMLGHTHILCYSALHVQSRPQRERKLKRAIKWAASKKLSKRHSKKATCCIQLNQLGERNAEKNPPSKLLQEKPEIGTKLPSAGCAFRQTVASR